MDYNIVEEFKRNAKELGVLYKTKRDLIELIDQYESRLKELGQSLEMADNLESLYEIESTYTSRA